MRSLLVLMVLGLVALLSGCATTPGREAAKEAPVVWEKLSIRKVGVTPKIFWPERGESAMIRWSQNRKAKTAVEIRREGGERIRYIESLYPAGDHAVTWDGKDENGELAKPGIYLYSFQSEDKTGSAVAYDPSLTTGGEELKIERFTFDDKTRRFDFVMPRAGRARLRIGLSPVPYLRTLLNWEPLEAGDHALIWDGLDESGLIRSIEHPDLSINLAAFALPDNAIIVQGEKGLPLTGGRRPSQSLLGSALYLHASHPGDSCRDISVNVEFPNTQKNEAALPILNEKTLVRVSLDETDRNFMVNQGFEIMFFVDTVFLFEEEEGQDPFNFEWDTRGLSPGEHSFTVNIIGYEDHFGVQTVRVLKKGSL